MKYFHKPIITDTYLRATLRKVKMEALFFKPPKLSPQRLAKMTPLQRKEYARAVQEWYASHKEK